MVDGGLVSQKGDSPTKRLCIAIFSHCTQYISHCTLNRAHFTLYTLHTVYYTLHTLHTVHYTLYTLHFAHHLSCGDSTLQFFTAQHRLNWMFSDSSIWPASQVPDEQRKQCAHVHMYTIHMCTIHIVHMYTCTHVHNTHVHM